MGNTFGSPHGADLDETSIRNHYLLPRIDESVDQPQGTIYLSEIDLRSEYRQLRVLMKDVPRTIFQTRYGHYESIVIPLE